MINLSIFTDIGNELEQEPTELGVGSFCNTLTEQNDACESDEIKTSKPRFILVDEKKLTSYTPVVDVIAPIFVGRSTMFKLFTQDSKNKVREEKPEIWHHMN